ncbi:hypothetical protein [Jonesia denitrificans]|uniref:Uncharacterized protein n=1 Tax=Jonesia denitrificans (strain ATCC 14870 / DSM 20603 / BCRC 15368 / CIP 55.134 / JCM 11481 / NBRC 15587 / NCTC 10816 / Prevot 55134) TaxID=471856 RepID=C7R3W6_JONDD|nr:hypothetical protein [Jonesia denitrificans]ACV08823.1 hypothetical protein Jden_1167 [Jonesia denitrificans DSM 20603]ASE09858.1 hypothetical protein CEP80_12520 [Jonesia denitrificans]QXB44392.1 hypothetical protein I6L70_06160 [Jonesia denitrificans]SQH20812.1 Uncharacterised protein [Jonesia denitrificans]
MRINPFLVLAVGIAMTAWVAGARALWGLPGSHAVTYLGAVGLPILVGHLLLARAQARARRQHTPLRSGVWGTLVGSWVCLFLLGLFLPERVDGHLTHIIVGTQEPARGLLIGFANPLGIIGVALLIAAVIMASLDARPPRPSEDDLLDAAFGE